MARQRQLQVALATVIVGVVGGMARILPENIGGPPWVGVSLVSAAMVMAAYAVMAQHVFLAAEVTVRALRWSLLAGLGIVAYVALLLALDGAVRAYLGIDFPLVLVLAVVVTIALFDPVAERLRDVRAATDHDVERGRLLRALGADAIMGQEPERAVEPALARLARTFDLAGAEVPGAQGDALATVGEIRPDDPLAVRLELVADDIVLGQVTFGAKRTGLPVTTGEMATLREAASYLASSLRLAERQRAQATALTELREAGSAVQVRGSVLSDRLADAADVPPGLRIHALGPLRAERDGEPVRRWGGEKAGSRQAEAIFAFLFDRGERGAAKDEFLELVLARRRSRSGRCRLPPHPARPARNAAPRWPRTIPGRADHLPQRSLPAGPDARRVERRGRVLVPPAPRPARPNPTMRCRSWSARAPCTAATTSTTAPSTATACTPRSAARTCACATWTCSSTSPSATGDAATAGRLRPACARPRPCPATSCHASSRRWRAWVRTEVVPLPDTAAC